MDYRLSFFEAAFFGNLLLLAILSSAQIGSDPASSQSSLLGSSCDVSPSSDWGDDENPGDYIAVSSPGARGFFEFLSGDEDIDDEGIILPLDKDLSTEWSNGAWSGFGGIQVDNNSATSIRMVLEPGKKYTFCIDFSSRGDVYLLSGSGNPSNYDIYTTEYMCDDQDWGPICNPEEMESIPLEWRDLATWITFRDSHAYESVSYQEFDVAIDASGSSWSFAGFGGSSEQVFYLVLDGWNNSKPGDELPAGDMSVEVLILSLIHI